MKIKLGQEVSCKVTGFTGIAVAKIKYINGCVQYCVKPTMTESGKMPDGEYIDVGQLHVTGKGIKIAAKDTGGTQRDCPKQ